MKLEDALMQIATDANLDAAALIAYAAEDNVGGRDTIWPGMSTFSDEGRVLYALIRALRPAQIVEVGVDSGGTSTHILTALEANGAGALWSVDVNPDCGAMVPQRLRARWTFVVGDALTVELPERADFVFEDGDHSYEFTRDVLLRLKELNPRMIMSHDYYTHETYQGFFVKQGFDEALPGAKGVKIDGAFTGLGYWVNADYGKEPEPVHILMDAEELEPEPVAVSESAVEPKPTPEPPKRRGGRPRKAAK